MYRGTDIVIIGGGIIGCAIFYEISKLKLAKVILLEKNNLASGTTGESGGFLRRFIQDPCIFNLVCNSFDYYQHFKKATGFSCGFELKNFKYRMSSQQFAGLTSNLKRLKKINYSISDYLDHDLIIQEEAAFINTTLACQNWVRAGQQLGGACYEHVLAESILIENGKLTGIKTSKGIISCRQVIIAMGSQTSQLLNACGIDSPFSIKSFQYNFYKSFNHSLLPYLDLVDELYILPLKDNQVLAGFLNVDKEESFNHEIDSVLARKLHTLIAKQVPALKDEFFITKKSYDAFTPNQGGFNVETEIKGVFISSGWSGGGVKVAPTIAKEMVSLIQHKLKDFL